ncbi:CocE/NonD family hydrolase [Actinomadura namibiensis]|uniref:Dienelactone hydrolase n=1 Tax=Actinomadura namibiensis TaxID=182080 RepID=A0A7W3QQR8_ACTNM|nr:CocE/NonD family hydrolase [Actinomadura namibiensis]MBA8955916.1 dienelactone hydrolase [Actinomadura namibiensis]
MFGYRAAAVLALAATAGTAAVAVPPAAVARAGAPYDYREISIPSVDGVRLDGNVFVPRAKGPHPAIVFISSWSLEDHEYIAQAAKFAAKGYIVLSYTARGFFNSGGGIDVAGPKDAADGSRAIDWLLAHTPVDRSRIGFAGISYGSGISQIVAARDRRVSAVVAMDTWGDLVESLYANETRHMGAYTLLALSGRLTGRLSPETERIMNDFGANRNVPELVRWGKVRSPGAYRDRLNARRVPILISNAYGETLFAPNQLLRHFAGLTGPRRLNLSIGDHATAHLTGLLGLDGRTWNDAHRWFDRHLRGVANGIDREPPIASETAWTRRIETYRDVAAMTRRVERLGLGAPGATARGDGTLGALAPAGWARTLRTGRDSGANAGIVIVSGGLQTFGLPNAMPERLVSRRAAAVWSTPVLTATRRLRGVPRLDLTVTPSRRTGTLVSYLYDVDARGTARLITNEAHSLLRGTPGRPHKITVNLQATAYDVPAGHRLMLVLDTRDPIYADAGTPGGALTVRAPSTLDLPLG